MIVTFRQFVTQCHLERPLVFCLVNFSPSWVGSERACIKLLIQPSTSHTSTSWLRVVALLVNLQDRDNLPTKDKISAPTCPLFRGSTVMQILGYSDPRCIITIRICEGNIIEKTHYKQMTKKMSIAAANKWGWWWLQGMWKKIVMYSFCQLSGLTCFYSFLQLELSVLVMPHMIIDQMGALFTIHTCNHCVYTQLSGCDYTVINGIIADRTCLVIWVWFLGVTIDTNTKVMIRRPYAINLTDRSMKKTVFPGFQCFGHISLTVWFRILYMGIFVEQTMDNR